MASLTGPLCGNFRRVGKGYIYPLLRLYFILKHRETFNVAGFVVLIAPVIAPLTS
jgi:hypothetical protein